jgi:hypothetical protein
VQVVRPLLLAGLLFFSGCGLPSWRVFQAKVPVDAPKSAAVIESERSAAQFIEQRSVSADSDPIAQLAEIHSVAVPLSTSLGEPKLVIVAADKDKIISGLRKGVLAEQKKADDWKKFAQKYAGKPLEDTGVNIAGPTGLLVLGLVIAACVAFPPVGYVLLRVLPLLWGFFKRTTTAISEFVEANPTAGDELKAKLGDKMDLAHKKLVKRCA